MQNQCTDLSGSTDQVSLPRGSQVIQLPAILYERLIAFFPVSFTCYLKYTNDLFVIKNSDKHLKFHVTVYFIDGIALKEHSPGRAQILVSGQCTNCGSKCLRRPQMAQMPWSVLGTLDRKSVV